MFGSEILDVAIGLIFMFLLLSLVCSSIKEAFETVLKFRARDLARGLREMFGDKDGTGFVAALYRHPLIDGLYIGDYSPKKASNLPSYIPSRLFALTVMDLLKPASAHSTAGAADATVAASDGMANAGEGLSGLRSAVSLSENATVKRALLPLIDAAGNDALRARQNIEDWFNGSMDRVSGWYKRRTQIIIGSVALLVALLMNVDTVSIARYLSTSQTARSVIVARLNESTKVEAPTTYQLTDPIGWLERQGGVPVGWLFDPEPGQTLQDYARDWRRPPITFGGWLLKLAGIAFTAFAITLGAPFWFDVLNKFMVIRSTVKPQEKSGQEPSKA